MARGDHRPLWQRLLRQGAGWTLLVIGLAGVLIPVMPQWPFLADRARCCWPRMCGSSAASPPGSTAAIPEMARAHEAVSATSNRTPGPAGGESPLQTTRPADACLRRQRPGRTQPRTDHMIRSFVFSQGKLISQDPALDFLKMVLIDEDAQIWVDLDSPPPRKPAPSSKPCSTSIPWPSRTASPSPNSPRWTTTRSYLFLVIHAVDFSSAEHKVQTSELNLFIGPQLPGHPPRPPPARPQGHHGAHQTQRQRGGQGVGSPDLHHPRSAVRLL
jgi:hypothetical protein